MIEEIVIRVLRQKFCSEVLSYESRSAGFVFQKDRFFIGVKAEEEDEDDEEEDEEITPKEFEEILVNREGYE